MYIVPYSSTVGGGGGFWSNLRSVKEKEGEEIEKKGGKEERKGREMGERMNRKKRKWGKLGKQFNLSGTGKYFHEFVK